MPSPRRWGSCSADDIGDHWPDGEPIFGPPDTFEPVFNSRSFLPPQTNTVTEDANPDSADGDVLAQQLVVTAVDGSAGNVGQAIGGLRHAASECRTARMSTR